MQDRHDIRIGRAVVKAHRNGGWALPGRQVTRDQHEAVEVAMKIDRLIGDRPLDRSETSKTENARKRSQGLSRLPGYTKPFLYD